MTELTMPVQLSSPSALTPGAGPKTALQPRRIFSAVLGLACFAAVWQLIGERAWLGGSIPPITEILQTMHDRATLLERAGTSTLTRALTGGAAGFAIGVALAAVTAWFPRAEGSVVRSAVVINAVPVVALGPVLMTLPVRAAIPQIFAALAVVFSTVLAVSDGFRSGSRASDDVFAIYGAARWSRFTRLQLPSALPLIADALRLAVPAAVLGTLIGEWFGSDRGLGVVMISTMRNIQYSLLWSAAGVAVLGSLVLYAVAGGIERMVAGRFGRPVDRARTIHHLSPAATAALTLAALVVVVAGWQAWISLDDVSLLVAPGPRAVAGALGSDLGSFLGAAGTTTLSALGGLAAGALIGLALAVVITLVPFVSSALSPLTILVPTIPIVVFVPILGSIFGYGGATVFVSCIVMAFFPVYALALTGLATRPPGSADVFAIYGAPRRTVMWRLALPSALPSLMLAVRLSAANCFLIALSAEWLMGIGGLGRVFSERRVDLDTAGSWAAVVVAIGLSLVAYAAAGALERVVIRRWM